MQIRPCRIYSLIIKGEKVAAPAVTQGTQFVYIGRYLLNTSLPKKSPNQHFRTFIFIAYGGVSAKIQFGQQATTQDFCAVLRGCHSQWCWQQARGRKLLRVIKYYNQMLKFWVNWILITFFMLLLNLLKTLQHYPGFPEHILPAITHTPARNRFRQSTARLPPPGASTAGEEPLFC